MGFPTPHNHTFYISLWKRATFILWIAKNPSTVEKANILLTLIQERFFFITSKITLAILLRFFPLLNHDGTTIVISVSEAKLFSQTFQKTPLWTIQGILLFGWSPSHCLTELSFCADTLPSWSYLLSYLLPVTIFPSCWKVSAYNLCPRRLTALSFLTTVALPFSCLSKAMTTSLNRKFLKHLSTTNFLSDHQCEFRKELSKY